MKSSTMKKLVNALSTFRLFVGFAVGILAFSGSWLIAFCLILAGFLSDLIDGPLARRFKVETKGGKALDLTADIIMDECIIGALFLLGKISLPTEIIMTVAIVFIRFPVMVESQVLVRVGMLSFSAYSPGMLWLIGKHYALPALGHKVFTYAIACAILIGLVIIFLKRERIMGDLKKARKAFTSSI